MTATILRYEGKYDWMPGSEGKQWTIISPFIDENGYDRTHGTFGIEGLKELGILTTDKKTGD